MKISEPQTTDITTPVREILDRLDPEKKIPRGLVSRIDFYPHRTCVVVYVVDENGNKFLDKDGDVATRAYDFHTVVEGLE